MANPTGYQVDHVSGNFAVVRVFHDDGTHHNEEIDPEPQGGESVFDAAHRVLAERGLTHQGTVPLRAQLVPEGVKVWLSDGSSFVQQDEDLEWVRAAYPNCTDFEVIDERP